MRPYWTAPIAFVAILVSCTSNFDGSVPDGATLVAPGEGPDNARPGACYGKDTTPATIETVTERVLVKPAKFAPGGGIVEPAQYSTSTRQQVAKGGSTYYFEVPCQADMTPDFIASVQRALTAREYYRGPINGRMDRRTRAAIRTFQLPDFNSDILTMETAQELGLVAIAPPPDAYSTQ